MAVDIVNSDFDWLGLRQSVSSEAYEFWELNHDSPVGLEIFCKIMTDLCGKEVPKVLKKYGETFEEVHQKTREEFNFWEGKYGKGQ